MTCSRRYFILTAHEHQFLTYKEYTSLFNSYKDSLVFHILFLNDFITFYYRMNFFAARLNNNILIFKLV